MTSKGVRVVVVLADLAVLCIRNAWTPRWQPAGIAFLAIEAPRRASP